jgi:hypothetical protein
MVDTKGCWREMGDTVVPDSSLVTDNKYWRIMGALLALALLIGENLHPISPAVIYALLSNITPRPDTMDVIHLNLSLVQQLHSSKVDTLLPWMIIPPGQDWRSLPDGHRKLLIDVMTNLDIGVSKTRPLFLARGVTLIFQSSTITTQSEEDHIRWTAVIVTASMFGNSFFFATLQFREMACSFKKPIEGDDRWFQVS